MAHLISLSIHAYFVTFFMISVWFFACSCNASGLSIKNNIAFNLATSSDVLLSLDSKSIFSFSRDDLIYSAVISKLFII